MPKIRGVSLPGEKYGDKDKSASEGGNSPTEGGEKETESSSVPEPTNVEGQVPESSSVPEPTNVEGQVPESIIVPQSINILPLNVNVQDTCAGGISDTVLTEDAKIQDDIDEGAEIQTETMIETETQTVIEPEIQISPTQATPSSTVLATGSGATSTEPTPASQATPSSTILAIGGSTSQVPGSGAINYESDDKVVVDTKVLLGNDWPHHVAYSLVHSDKGYGLLGCKQNTSSLTLWNLATESEAFRARLEGNVLLKAVNNSYKKANRVLITALVERWQPLTNTFHMPFGEMTITLDDVRHIIGLPVEGNPLSFEVKDIKYPVKYVHNLLGISEIDVAAEFKHSQGPRVSRSWLRSNLQGKGGVIIGVGKGSSSNQPAPMITVDQAIRGYLLYVLSCTLFQDRSGDKISIGYLHFLEDLDVISKWAWGAATLASVYRQLGQCTRMGAAAISGYLTLVEAWVYEHFPDLQGKSNPAYDPATMCRCMKWKPKTGSANDDDALKLLVQMREQLDLIEAKDVVWDAYKDVRVDVANDDVCWYYGCIRRMDIVEAYHPNRVVRQFGHVQIIPQPPRLAKTSNRSANVKQYKVVHETCDDDFIHFDSRVVSMVMRGGKAKFAWECAEGYMEWYSGVAYRRLTSHKKRVSEKEKSINDRVIEILTDAHTNLNKMNKKELGISIKNALDFMTTGACTKSQQQAEAEVEVEAVREPQTRKRPKKISAGRKKVYTESEEESEPEVEAEPEPDTRKRKKRNTGKK